MRRELARKLKQVFSDRVAQLSPPFVAVKSEYVSDRNQVYRAQLTKNFFAFFCLLFSTKGRDEFNIDVTWNMDPEYPAHPGIGMPVDIPEIGIPRGRPLNNSFSFRLANLIPPHNDKSWTIDVPQQVEPVVDRVMKIIIDQAIPYLCAKPKNGASIQELNDPSGVGSAVRTFF